MFYICIIDNKNDTYTVKFSTKRDCLYEMKKIDNIAYGFNFDEKKYSQLIFAKKYLNDMHSETEMINYSEETFANVTNKSLLITIDIMELKKVKIMTV
jgi:hypothetical protein